ncbi:MAG: VanZ family protein [Clostridium sp.]|uniref:VanZ family protein n=1 Tax=Clostridium sp. TaxID=1506 RepID=UPI001EBF13FD|nr:VanZ family protein [Clostridium sp.]MBS5886819.1 VanZ family protein [Clostridium sp.]MDU7150351.1 VanZ family protein [Clostridium sp.]MDU7243548.1 VanZ family protein [Clostridium sp.]
MNKNKKMISWIMLIAWMGIIFFMSHQPGEVSSSQSELVLKIFSFLGIELNQYFGELATLVIRKTAHFSEYLILFLFAYNVSRFYFTTKKARLYSIIFVFLYASTDEFHQYFIPGRNMAFKDVLIDTSGGVIGFLIMKIVEIVKLNK